MPELFLKADPSQRRDPSQEVAQALYATGEWEFAPGQRLFLTDRRGETFAVDSSQAQNFLLGGRLDPEGVGFEATESINRRAQRRSDIEEYSEGVGNTLLMGVEAVGRGLTLGGTDLLFGGKGAEVRREEAGGFATALEIGGALLPALVTAGGTTGVSGAKIAGQSLAKRLLASTPSGLVLRGGEAIRVATRARMAGLAGTGVLGRTAAALAPSVAQGAFEGALYGAGEGVSQLGLSEDPITSEAIFSKVGGGALHGAAFGGAILGGAAAGGKILKKIHGRVTRRLNESLDAVGRRELAERLASGADEQINAFRRELAASDEIERLALLEKQSVAKKVYREVKELREIGVAGRKKTLEETFEAERKAVLARSEGKVEALEKVDANMRRMAVQNFGPRALKDNAELMALGRKFSSELKDVYGSLGHSNRLIQEASDLTGRVLPLRQWKGVYAQFKKTFVPGGKLVQDPEKLARLLTKPGNRELLQRVEQTVVDVYGDLSGQEIFFDDLLANWKITDEFISASELGLDKEAGRRLQKDMFDKHMGFIQRDRKIAQQEIMSAGEDAYQDLVLREASAVKRLRDHAALDDLVDRGALDDLTRQIEDLGARDMPKRLEKALLERTDRVAEVAAEAGLNLSMTDKLSIAAAVGLELDVIPSGTLLDRVVQLAAVAKLSRNRSVGALLTAVASKTPGVGKLAARGMRNVAGEAVRGGVGKATNRAMKRTFAESIGDISNGLVRRMKDAEISLLRAVDKSVDAFLRGGRRVRRAIVPTSLKILNATSFSGDEPRQLPKHKNVVDAFNAKSQELSQAVANPNGLQDMMGERLGLLDFQDPILSGQLMGLALRRIQFLHDKMPKNPGLGAFGAHDRWRPSDSDIARWSRFIVGTDDPVRSLEDMAAGRLSPEQAEAMRVIYPEIFQKVQMDFFEKISEGRSTTYQQRNQLSILFGTPVDFSQRPEFLLAMQANFLPTQQPAPASQVNPGRLSTETLAPPTPAQRTLER